MLEILGCKAWSRRRRRRRPKLPPVSIWGFDRVVPPRFIRTRSLESSAKGLVSRSQAHECIIDVVVALPPSSEGGELQRLISCNSCEGRSELGTTTRQFSTSWQ